MGYQRRYDNRPRGNPETDEGRDQRSGLIILQRTKDLIGDGHVNRTITKKEPVPLSMDNVTLTLYALKEGVL